MSVLKTPLYDCHLSLDASMAVFANTWLPVRYFSEKDEHLAVRNNAGLFDVSHMGEFLVSGPEARTFLQCMLTRNMHAIKCGQAYYGLMLNEQGGIIDDLLIYCLKEDTFLLVVNAANIQTDWQWLHSHVRDSKIKLSNVSHDYALLALQGPKALHILNALGVRDLRGRFQLSETQIKSLPCIIARTGYTGEDGVEIFINPADAKDLWNLLLLKGQDFGIKPCGLAARDSLRLEAGFLLHGSDINAETSPLSAHLNFAIDQHNDVFIGKKALEATKQQGIRKSLMGFRLLERGIARSGFEILNDNGQIIGNVTSGSWPPSQESAIGLAYLMTPTPDIGSLVYIKIRDRLVKAQISRPRFLRH